MRVQVGILVSLTGRLARSSLGICPVLLVCLAVLLPDVVRAEPVRVPAEVDEIGLVAHTTWVSDPRPAAAWAEVLGDLDWRPLPARGSMGVLDGPHWLRMDVRVDAPRRLYLHMNEMGLERGALVHVSGGRVVDLSTLSRTEPLSSRDVPHRSAIFPVELPPGTSTLLLRVESHEAVQARLRLISPQAFAGEEHRIQLVWAGFIGLIGGLAVYNLFLWVTLRDRAYLLYVLMALFTHGLLLLHTGGMSYTLLPFLPPTTVRAFGHVVGGLGALAAAGFSWDFLKIRQIGRFSRPAYVAYVVLCTLLIAGPFLPPSAPFVLALIILGFTPILFVGSGLESWLRGHAPARWYLLAWSALCAASVVTLVEALGWVPLYTFQGGALLLGAAIEVTLLSVALADRIRGLQAEHREAVRVAEGHRRVALQAQLSSQKQKGAFLSMMGHELRTPLHQILGLSQLLELTEEDLERREQLGMVRSGGTVLLNMIDDMLLFSALREGRGRGLPSVCTGAQLLDGLDRHHLRARERGQTLEVRGDTTELVLDVHLVRRALDHLVDNAIKFAPAGTIEIRATCRAGTLVLDVLDRGPGIPADRLDAVFGLFEQDQAGMQRADSGIGLGLSMCRAIAEALGGSLELIERDGGGTHARLVVPSTRGETLEYDTLGVSGRTHEGERFVRDEPADGRGAP